MGGSLTKFLPWHGRWDSTPGAEEGRSETGYRIVGGRPIKPDSILYALLGGTLSYLWKGAGIFEWLYCDGPGLLGSLLRASKLEIEISSVFFKQGIKPLENIQTPRIMAPVSLCFDALRIISCLLYNYKVRRDNSRYTDPHDRKEYYRTLKKIIEIIVGYVVGGLVTYLFVEFFILRRKRNNSNSTFPSGYYEKSGNSILGIGPAQPMPHVNPELETYITIIISCLVATIATFLSEEICRCLFSHIGFPRKTCLLLCGPCCKKDNPRPRPNIPPLSTTNTYKNRNRTMVVNGRINTEI